MTWRDSHEMLCAGGTEAIAGFIEPKAMLALQRAGADMATVLPNAHAPIDIASLVHSYPQARATFWWAIKNKEN